MAGDEPFARLRPQHVGRAGGGAQAQFQGAALRPGKSDAPAGEYTLDMLAYDVHGLLQGLGVDRCHWARFMSANSADAGTSIFAAVVVCAFFRTGSDVSGDWPDDGAAGVNVARECACFSAGPFWLLG